MYTFRKLYIFHNNFIIAVEFIDYDLVTAFGAPWEMLLQNSYLIVKKGGLVGGYGGIVSFVPELQLSMYNQINT